VINTFKRVRPQTFLWTLQNTITLTEDALLIFVHTGVEKLLAWQGIELTTSDLKFSVNENE